MAKLSRKLTRDLLIISFLSVIIDDILFIYLRINVLILSPNSLLTEDFHLANSKLLFVPFF